MDNYHNLAVIKGRSFKSNESIKNTSSKCGGNTTKGVATCFGFKRRPVTAPSSSSITENMNVTRNLSRDEIIDTNGNGTIRTIAKPSQTRQETNNTKTTSRFGFRSKNANKNKSIEAPSITQYDHRNINRPPKVKSAPTTQYRLPPSNLNINSNENRSPKTDYSPTSFIGKYTLQYTQLARPQLPSRMVEPKEAKTMANNNRKNIRKIQSRLETSKNNSNNKNTQQDPYRRMSGSYDDDFLVRSPCEEYSNNSESNLGIENVNMFDLHDSDDLAAPMSALPSLPSAFQNTVKGFGRDRTYKSPKSNPKPKSLPKTTVEETAPREGEMKKSFLKPKPKEQTPEEYEWMQAGDAMADEISYSLSSISTHKIDETITITKPTTLIWPALTKSSSSQTPTNHDMKKMFMSNIDDPKFAAIAAASNTATLLEDETSPVDSLIFSYSESEDKNTPHNNDIKKKNMASSSESKDINEKLTKSSSTPGTPTNASSSLSLSDGKDYFDDEIADQPALVFDDATEPISILQQNSENTPTIINSTPKPRRKPLNALEGSPLFLRKRNFGSRANSMDTLSPCESITSDDLMLDFEHSQSSCAEDIPERNDNETYNVRHREVSSSAKLEENNINDILRECLGSSLPVQAPARVSHPARLLISRAGTPNSVQDTLSPKHNRLNSLTNPLMQRNVRKLSRPTLNDSVGYDSDDSVNLDKTNHSIVVQDITQMKLMLSKLKKVLNDSENINPFENQANSRTGSSESLDSKRSSAFELAELRRQIVFLQDQLEDREQTVIQLQKKMKNAPTACTVISTITPEEIPKSNAATQTERIRPISTSTSLIQMSPTDSSMGSLVSWSETNKKKNCFVLILDDSNSNRVKNWLNNTTLN